VSPRLPHYSTDIAAAWTVAEKLMESHFMLSLAVSHESGWGCIVWGPQGARNEIDFAGTAPLAICCAALAAVGAEVPT
jgi:hypothetical protein